MDAVKNRDTNIIHRRLLPFEQVVLELEIKKLLFCKRCVLACHYKVLSFIDTIEMILGDSDVTLAL